MRSQSCRVEFKLKGEKRKGVDGGTSVFGLKRCRGDFSPKIPSIFEPLLFIGSSEIALPSLPRSLPFTYQPTLVPSAQLLSSFTFPRNSRSKFSNGSLVTRRGRKRSRCSKCRALDTTWTPLNENLSEIFVEKRCVDVCMDKKKRFFFE